MGSPAKATYSAVVAGAHSTLVAMTAPMHRFTESKPVNDAVNFSGLHATERGKASHKGSGIDHSCKPAGILSDATSKRWKASCSNAP